MSHYARLVSLNDVRRAARIIAPNIHRTQTVSATRLGKRVGVELYLKLEMFQKTGSFKPRGALNKMAHLSGEEKARGVVSLSAGNHAQALAYAATMSGVHSTIVMPANAVTAKVDATRAYGGEVVLTDADLLQTALRIQQERGMTLVHPFDDLHTIAGAGTVGAEIMDEMPDADVVICGVGGGGLISGVGAAVKAVNARTRVIGVEPSGAPGMTLALDEGEPVHLDSLNTIADGLAAPFVGRHNLDHVRAFADDIVTVEDDDILDAMRLILEYAKTLAEPAGASPYAALLTGAAGVNEGDKVVCVLSGGNLDAARLADLFSATKR